MKCERILMDISYARTQTGNVGITRAVRRLSQELQRDSPDVPGGCMLVAFHSRGFRVAATRAASADSREAASARSFAARLLRYFMSGPSRSLISKYLPRNFAAWAWRVHARWAFDSLSAAESPVRFGPGDVLVLGDQSWNYQVWLGALKARSQGAKVVLMVYDLIPLRHPEFCNWLFTRVFERWLFKMVGVVDAIVCISGSTRQDLLEFLTQRKIVSPPTEHFRLGSDLDGSGAGGEVRAMLKTFAQKAACFLAVGTVEPRKNYGVLLDSFECLWAAGDDVRLVICGALNPESASLAYRLSRHPEAGHRLLWLADATDAEVIWMYSTFRALVFPSLAEGFGLPLVEARTRGCPVIASDIPSLAELADDGVSLFDPRSTEQLIALIREHTSADRHQKAGAMDSFTWAQSARDFFKAAERGLTGGTRALG